MGKMNVKGCKIVPKKNGKGRMCVLQGYEHRCPGHAEVAWDVADPTSVALAEKEFNEIKEVDGMMPVKVTESESGDKSFEKIDTFDPEAPEIMWYPRIMGG